MANFIKLSVNGKKTGVSIESINGANYYCIYTHKTPATMNLPLLNTSVGRVVSQYAGQLNGSMNLHGLLYVYQYLMTCFAPEELTPEQAVLVCKEVFQTEDVQLGDAPSTNGPVRRSTRSGAFSYNEGADCAWLARGYQTGVYRGFGEYCHNSNEARMNRPTDGYAGYRIGVELEVEFEEYSDREDFCREGSNWFMCKHDGSLGDYGCEIVTIPLKPSDARAESTWKALTEKLTSLGATSWDTHRCGLHVHIGRECLGEGELERQASIGRIYGLTEKIDQSVLKSIFGRGAGSTGSSDSSGRWCRATRTSLDEDAHRHNLLNEISGAAMYAYAKKAQDGGDRYRQINTCPTQTIEFRQGRGSINYERIVGVIEFTSYMAEFCSNIKNELTVEKFGEFLLKKRASRWLLNRMNIAAQTEQADR